jgi:rhomboid protease GluP
MMTFWVMVVQLGLYIATLGRSHSIGLMLEPTSDVLLSFGANSRVKVQCFGHYHRLLSHILLHWSLVRLTNFLSEFLFVLQIEFSWGILKFAIVYVVSGITGGLLSDWATPHCSVGASCSILGAMGARGILTLIYIPQLDPAFR